MARFLKQEFGLKTLGLLGGMSWQSTVPYYRIINEETQRRLGGMHSAKLILYSVDFHEVEQMQHAGDWPAAAKLLADAAQALQRAGAQGLLLCTNTMHKVVASIEGAISIPVLHIADATAAAVRRANIQTVGLLGTRFTMEQDFYVGRLREQHSLKVLVPAQDDREQVHRIIYQELCLGQVSERSRQVYQEIIGRLRDAGAQGIVLGCTEIAMLVSATDSAIPLFDTTDIHARHAVDWTLGRSA